VTGNPDRFLSGTTRIRAEDGAWRSELPARSKLAAAALGWPLMRRYGYRLRRPGGAPEATGERQWTSD
jgi:hypothetical protein